MKKELYIHLGLPKTATTTLQNRVFLDQQTDYLYLGKHNPKYTPDSSEKDAWFTWLKSALIHKDAPFFSTCNFSVVLENKFGDQPENQKYLLSEEAFFSRCLTPQSYSKLIMIGSPRHVLNNLSCMFKHQDEYTVRLIFVLRNQPDLVESFFAQSYFLYEKHIELTTPDEFARYIFDLGDYSPIDSLLRYDSIINFMKELFGSENVLVLPYEKMVSHPDVFLEELSNYMGITPWDYRVLKAQKDNFGDTKSGKLATIPPISHRLVELKNSLIGNKSFGIQKYFNFLDIFTPKKAVTLSQDMRQRIFNQYRESNENLRGRVKYIDEFNYF